jgi:hypothetical protein
VLTVNSSLRRQPEAGACALLEGLDSIECAYTTQCGSVAWIGFLLSSAAWYMLQQLVAHSAGRVNLHPVHQHFLSALAVVAPIVRCAWAAISDGWLARGRACEL